MESNTSLWDKMTQLLQEIFSQESVDHIELVIGSGTR